MAPSVKILKADAYIVCEANVETPASFTSGSVVYELAVSKRYNTSHAAWYYLPRDGKGAKGKLELKLKCGSRHSASILSSRRGKQVFTATATSSADARKCVLDMALAVGLEVSPRGTKISHEMVVACVNLGATINVEDLVDRGWSDDSKFTSPGVKARCLGNKVRLIVSTDNKKTKELLRTKVLPDVFLAGGVSKAWMRAAGAAVDIVLTQRLGLPRDIVRDIMAKAEEHLLASAVEDVIAALGIYGSSQSESSQIGGFFHGVVIEKLDERIRRIFKA